MSTDKDKLLQRISKNLRKLREDRGFTQEHVADKIGIHLVTYQKYESRHPYNITVFNLHKLAAAFDITVDALLK